jgi:hypothetical protein
LQAKRQTGYAEKQAKVEATIRQLTEQCAAQAQQLEASQQEITQLKRDQAQWQQDADSWQQDLQQQAALADSQSISQSVLALKQKTPNSKKSKICCWLKCINCKRRWKAIIDSPLCWSRKKHCLAQCDEHSRSAMALAHERENLLKQLATAELKQVEQLQSGQTALAALQAELDTVQPSVLPTLPSRLALSTPCSRPMQHWSRTRMHRLHSWLRCRLN